MNQKGKFKSFISNYKWWLVTALIIIVGCIFVFGNGNRNNIETITLTPTNFTRQVAVAGKVIPAEEVELGFDQSGRVAAVYKGVGEEVVQGETIAVLSSGNTSAEISKAEAELLAEQAKLNELKLNSNLGSSVNSKESELDQAVAEAYTRADDAIRNSVDQVFDEGEIVFAFDDYDLKKEIDKERKEIGYLLKRWEEDRDDDNLAENNLNIIKQFLDKVALAVNDFQMDRGGYTQAQIDGFKDDIFGARTSINTAIGNLTTAKENLRDVESEIPFQEAKVLAAKAEISRLRAELGKSIISSPFSGIITLQDGKVGQVVGSNQIITKMISKGNFQIETFVPELNIGEVKVGNTAKVTLDAYGKEVFFEARVILIDPAETLRDGVSTYKTTFEFVSPDERLRSGMTANVIITTEEKSDTILIPADALIRKDGQTFVQIKVGDETVEKMIALGATSITGEIEVLSGLNAGEKVVRKPEVEKK